MPTNVRKRYLNANITRFAGFGPGLILLCIAVANAGAAAPEYAKLRAEVGMGVEIKGAMNADGMFVASDIAALPQRRQPKLRGELTAVDGRAGTIVLFGRTILVDGDTEIEGVPLAKLKSGRRVEVKCEVDTATGEWHARSLTSVAIKESDKIKGTITQLFMNGTPPDTLVIDGLMVLLDEKTDLEEALLLKDKRQRELLGRLAADDARSLRNTHVLSDGLMGLEVQYRHNVARINGHDLTGSFDSDRDDTQPELRVRWSGFWHHDLRTYAEARLRRRFVLASDLNDPNGDFELQFIQAYAVWRDVADGGVAVAVGRQDFDEPREWLYDEYLDAVRLFYYGSDRFGLQAAYIHAVSPLKEKFATWTDLYVAADLFLAKDNKATMYVLSRQDSDEIRKREPVWWGLRYYGKPTARTKAWLELAMMRGQDKHRTLRAAASDVGFTYLRRDLGWSPSVTVGYAHGSGSNPANDPEDGRFRQTGYQDNSARFGGVTSVLYYGAVLEPELSNLNIFTLGLGVRPIRDASVDVFYHRYHQDWPSDRVRGGLVDPPARPNGQSDDIGWEADLVVGLPRLWDVLRASLTLGMFEPGAAFSPRQDRAVLVKLNITVRI